MLLTAHGAAFTSTAGMVRGEREGQATHAVHERQPRTETAALVTLIF
jgi:hypothetical protein